MDPDDEGTEPDLGEVLSPITLPCGRALANRLVKAATYEHLAPFLGGPPTAALCTLYEVWGKGEWGMVITGNVQVSRRHLSLGADMTIPECISDGVIERFRRLACAMRGEDSKSRDRENANTERVRPLVIMQLNHTGRQSPNGLGGRWPFFQPPLSASATRVGTSPARVENLLSRLAYAVLFQKARAMSAVDIDDVVDGFVRGAKVAVTSGFDGVQIHAAHGYLIAQFISRKTNLRTDVYAAPLALLHDVVRAVRAAVPRHFVVGIKLNSADYVSGGMLESEGRAHLAAIASWEWDGAGVDFIEISGGDYEAPEFMQAASPRQAFFESFAHIAVEAVQPSTNNENGNAPTPTQPRPRPLIMLTGGLRTRGQLARALQRGHAHLLGLARPATLQPALPRLIRVSQDVRAGPGFGSGTNLSESELASVHQVLRRWETQPPPEPRAPAWWPRIVGAGVGMAWHIVAMHRRARGRPLPYGAGWLRIVLEMYLGNAIRDAGGAVIVVFSMLLLAAAFYFAPMPRYQVTY
ncbi:hypothetical protein M0805_001345 [Coniferiporia weirii]|nr:hypothetical protein M0805_001345 [Coniferiporia weirii]